MDRKHFLRTIHEGVRVDGSAVVGRLREQLGRCTGGYQVDSLDAPDS